jgi:mersacidin/lichenicidin family type 2 lantibiotic
MKIDIARAWKDEEYRNSLSAEELAQLPMNPAGAFELAESELESVHGAGKKGSHGDTVSYALICAQTVLLAICNGMSA